MTAGFPLYNKQHFTGEIGVNEVSKIVNEQFGWIFRRNPAEYDFGIDGYVDVVSVEGAVTGQCFAIQIKSGQSYFKTKTLNGYTFYGEEKHLNYSIKEYPKE